MRGGTIACTRTGGRERATRTKRSSTGSASSGRSGSCPENRCAALAQAAALVMRAEEVLAAGGRHRGARRDLERERGGGDDLREAVDLAGARAADQLEPFARVRERRSAADRAELEPG